MEKDIKAALRFLNSDYLLNVSIIEPIVCGTADVIYASGSCVMIKDKAFDTYMIQTEELDKADKLIECVPQNSLLVAHNSALAEFAMRKLGYGKSVPCYQAVYRKERFVLPATDLSVRLMREDEAELASEMYGFDVESAKQHIGRGLVYGGYLAGELVAMIGRHFEGSMGLLEVKEKFRRMGYAEYLEKYLINSLLNKGRVHYCQIIEVNEPSLSLQRKLGLDISKNMLYWLVERNMNICN